MRSSLGIFTSLIAIFTLCSFCEVSWAEEASVLSSKEDTVGVREGVTSFALPKKNKLEPNEVAPSAITEIEKQVTFCRPNNMVSALLYIAENKGFLKEIGVKPRFETATNAKICQDMLIAKRAEFMTGAEGPFTFLAASNPPLKILAMLQQNPETSIFARKDRGVVKFEDLKGKRVAYLPGTVSYFFLGRVLRKYNLSRSDVLLTAMQPPSMPAALIGGSIDAFSMWEPWGTQATSKMPDDIINLTDTELYRYEALFIGREDVISKDPELTKNLLRALIKAEHFIEDNNQEAFEILAKAIAFEPNSFKKLWKYYRHSVRVDPAVITLLKDNFEMLKEDDANFKDLPTPNFSAFVDPAFLEEVEPSRVMMNE